jgi:hypothetical protein
VTRRGAASSERRWPVAAPGGAGWQAACSLAGCWLQADSGNLRLLVAASTERSTIGCSQSSMQIRNAQGSQ